MWPDAFKLGSSVVKPFVYVSFHFLRLHVNMSSDQEPIINRKRNSMMAADDAHQ